MYTPDIDFDVPLTDYAIEFTDLRTRVDAAMAALEALDVEVDVTDDDIFAARTLLNPDTPNNPALLTSPGTVVHLKALLDEYDKQVVQSAAQIRTYVTNKLIEESASADPKIRMKALELLGKISDVGLFTEKTEVTMRHRPTEELENLLRERLMRTLGPEDGANTVEAVPVKPITLDPEALG